MSFSILAGPFLDAYSTLYLRDFCTLVRNGRLSIGFEEEKLNSDYNKNYVMTTRLTELHKFDSFLFLFINPRFEAPILDLRLKIVSRQKSIWIFVLGSTSFITHSVISLGNNLKSVINFVAGKNRMNNIFYKKDLCIFKGIQIYQRSDFSSIEKLLSVVTPKRLNALCEVNNLPVKASSVTACDIGISNSVFVKKITKTWQFVFGNNYLGFKKKGTSLIFVGLHHGSPAGANADLIHPILTPFEQIGLYANAMGIYRQVSKVISKDGKSKKINSFFLI